MTVRHTLVGLVLAAAVFCTQSSTHAQDQSMRVRIERLEQQVRDLQEEVRLLRSQLQAARPHRNAPNPTATPGIPIERPQDSLGTDGVSFFGVHSWLVRVEANTQALAAKQQAQIQTAQNQLADITKNLEDARRNADVMSQQQPVWDPYLGEQVMKNLHSQAEIDDAKAAVRRLEREEQAAQKKLDQIQHDADDAPGQRWITGQTADGRSVRLTATGDAEQLITQMQPDKWYRVTGASKEDDGILTIDIKTVVRPQDTP